MMKLILGAPRANTANDRAVGNSASLSPNLQRGLPYIAMLLAMLKRGEPLIEAAFGRHLHWGYWPEPERATGDAADFAAAAERLTREVCDAAEITDDMSLMDVGCGFGGTLTSLNERFQRMQLTGLDIDLHQIARARASVTNRNDNRIAFVAGDASCLPCADESFDRVLAIEAIFHFPDRVRFFNETRRVLKPGGRLALSDFLPVAWMQPALWFNVAAENYGRCDMRYSLPRYRRLAHNTGFRPVIERNVNANTLPTFAVLKSLRPLVDVHNKQSVRETNLLHAICRLGLLRYSILSFEKK